MLQDAQMDAQMNVVSETSDQPTLKVAAVARRLGVAPATLRTWARRYGLGPSAHLAGAHRQYSQADLTRLLVMRRLTLEGVAPAEAARVALSTEVDRPLAAPGGAGGMRGSSRRLHSIDRDGRRGDGTAVATEPARSRYAAQSAALLEAARALDSLGCAGHVGHLISEHGVARAWEQVLAPTLAFAGDRWQRSGKGVEVEHVLSDAVTAELHRASPVVTGQAGVLLACAADEQHALPLHVLAAAMAERGMGSRVLGARMPVDALADAIVRSAPRAVVVLAVMPRADVDQLAVLAAASDGARLFAAGPGWEPQDVPDGVEHLASLGDALDRLEDHLSTR